MSRRFLRSTRKMRPASINTESSTADSIDRAAVQKERPPADSLKPEGEEQVGSLLIFVPRDVLGTLINKLTGNYGYSHLAIDCGEIDG
jgi:hypothetical protein